MERYETPAAFRAVAGAFLVAREAEHNLIFGLCSTMESDPTLYPDPPYLAAVVRGNEVLAAAVRTPPWRLVLSEVNDAAAIGVLVADLVGVPLPGVQGPARWSASFAEAWSARTGRTSRLNDQLRIFRLTRVLPPRPAPSGQMRAAVPEDHEVVVAWLRGFHDEATPDDPPADYAELAGRWIRGQGRRLVVWEADGRAVSLTGITGPTPNGIRIGPVYTPPAYRARGYASNLVAAASQAELDSGRQFVFLFTDLSNPTSNRIYEAIGYEPVSDVDEFVFE